MGKRLNLQVERGNMPGVGGIHSREFAYFPTEVVCNTTARLPQKKMKI
jgi:hypothetical protein